MTSVIHRRFAATVFLLAALVVAGCGANEPQQRKAFITFLQTRIIDRHSLAVPVMNAEDRKAVGSYADHYQIIVAFNARMNDAMKSLEDADRLQSKLNSVQGLQNNWKELAPFGATLPKLGETLNGELQKAQTARDALKQPDDLKAVYDKAFAKTVSTPADAFKNMLPSLEKTFHALEELGRFLDDNKANVKISGMTVEIQDQALYSQFQKLQNDCMNNAKELDKANRALTALLR